MAAWDANAARRIGFGKDTYFMEWAESPVFHLFLSGAGMGLCIYLFLSVKHDIFRLDRRGRRAEESLSSVIADLKESTTRTLGEQEQAALGLRQEIKEVAECVGLLTSSVRPANGINLGNRTQVLQLARRGNRPDQIAACLQVPQNEVDLVLKVHRTIVRSF
jgi:hypothetical protein